MKKKIKKEKAAGDKPQTALPTKKHDPPVKTPVTDITSNITANAEGLNESSTTSEELLPLD